MSRKQDYKVTDASVFTVRPVVTEHRYQMIEEIPPPQRSGFIDFILGLLGLAVLIFGGLVVLGLISTVLGIQ